jgi:hypothetical protein
VRLLAGNEAIRKAKPVPPIVAKHAPKMVRSGLTSLRGIALIWRPAYNLRQGDESTDRTVEYIGPPSQMRAYKPIPGPCRG